MYEFTCEVCGKQCNSKTDPSTWKGGKICWDCRNKKQTAAQNTSPKPSVGSGYTTSSNTNYIPREFDLNKYLDDLFDIYECLKIKAESRQLEIPEANLCQWTTSILIQKDKR